MIDFCKIDSFRPKKKPKQKTKNDEDVFFIFFFYYGWTFHNVGGEGGEKGHNYN